MDMDEAWTLMRDTTRVVRERKNFLYTFGTTKLPYVCLTADDKEERTIHVRSGTVQTMRPQIAVPGLERHEWDGFFESLSTGAEGASGGEGEEDGEGARRWSVWLARRVAMPSGKYVNEQAPPRTERGPMEAALEREGHRMDDGGDIKTALIATDARVWPLAVLAYVAGQVARSAPSNIQEHFERRRGGGAGTPWNPFA